MTKRLALLVLLAGVLVAVPGPHDTARAAFAGKNGRIAFARGGDQDDGLPFHIHTVTLASGKITQVTSGRVQDLLPAWQPQQVSGAPRPPRPGRAGRRA